MLGFLVLGGTWVFFGGGEGGFWSCFWKIWDLGILGLVEVVFGRFHLGSW